HGVAEAGTVLDDDRDGDLRVIRGSESGEPESERLTFTVLSCSRLPAHSDSVYSAIACGAIVYVCDHQSLKRCTRVGRHRVREGFRGEWFDDRQVLRPNSFHEGWLHM